MALLLKTMYHNYYWMMETQADPRSNEFFLSSSIIYPTVIGFIYLQLVHRSLPKFMENRPPYSLKTPIKLFNLTQIIINVYIVISGWFVISKLDWNCALLDYSYDPFAYLQLRYTHLYYMVKLLDLLDTIFFVLRKKTSQVTFLHVYHHWGMIFLGFIGVKFIGGGHSLFLGYLNSIVHVVMYTYYLLSGWNEECRKFCGLWKKQITQMQLVQFTLFIVIYGRLLLNTECAFPRLVSFFLTTQAVFFLILFGEFYYHAYIKTKKPKKPVVE